VRSDREGLRVSGVVERTAAIVRRVIIILHGTSGIVFPSRPARQLSALVSRSDGPQWVVNRSSWSLAINPVRTGRTGSALCGECESAAGGTEHQLLRHLLFGQIDEILSATVHREYMLDIELL
jgi:hypothetical protein